MVVLKTARELAIMKEACVISAQALKLIGEAVEPGVSTLELDTLAEKFIRSKGARPNFKGLYGFPATACISINNEVIHGIPAKNRIIKAGDIVSVDLVVEYKGYMADACRTYAVGQISPEAQHLIDTAEAAFFEGMKYAKVGNRLGDISHAIQQKVESEGFGVIRDFVGHGIGQDMHEDPQIPNFAQRRRGVKLQAGMTLAIEPMINMGRADVAWLDDDWTVVSEDGSLSAHYENTILITEGEPEILTLY